MLQFLPYAPLTLALVQIPWFGIAFFIIIIFHADLEKNHAASRLLEFVTMLPGLIGLVIGVYAITRWPDTLAPRICLIVGMIGCALPQFSLGYELIFG